MQILTHSCKGCCLSAQHNRHHCWLRRRVQSNHKDHSTCRGMQKSAHVVLLYTAHLIHGHRVSMTTEVPRAQSASLDCVPCQASVPPVPGAHNRVYCSQQASDVNKDHSLALQADQRGQRGYNKVSIKASFSTTLGFL
jgi:hypothetical protein